VGEHPAGLERACALAAETADLPRPGEPVTLYLRPEAISLVAEEQPES
jgi:hypothetical protein